MLLAASPAARSLCSPALLRAPGAVSRPAHLAPMVPGAPILPGHAVSDRSRLAPIPSPGEKSPAHLADRFHPCVRSRSGGLHTFATSGSVSLCSPTSVRTARTWDGARLGGDSNPPEGSSLPGLPASLLVAWRAAYPPPLHFLETSR